MLKQPFIAGFTAMAALFLSLSSAHAACDPAKGEKIFIKCKTCHVVEKGGSNRIGPNLFGVSGRKTASYPGYNYSPAMKAANKTWNAVTLNKFLEKPSATVPGTRMTFIGLSRPQERADVICFLESRK